MKQPCSRHPLSYRSHAPLREILAAIAYLGWSCSAASLMASLMASLLVKVAVGQQPPAVHGSPSRLAIIVNSNQDGPIQADGIITLREAIALVNGDLPLTQLSLAEQNQVSVLSGMERSRIEFNLPTQQTTIQLIEPLPPIVHAGLTMDGTTQPGYASRQNPLDSDAIPAPSVAVTPTSGVIIPVGIWLTANNITVRGLSLYGFTPASGAIAPPPSADILINSLFQSPPPQGIVIEDNWLGISPDPTLSPSTSSFGVLVFNGVGVHIRRNQIANHSGSGILTAVQAQELHVTENVIVGNGRAGMPDAIRLEGQIDGSEIIANQIRENAGSGIFLFRSEGSITIQSNQIHNNGRRLQHAAIYLMGSDHHVLDNWIHQQTGPGVVVAAYPSSQRNIIRGNHFADLDGLSIDLNTQSNVGVGDYQRGDGPNPPRNSPNRRRETGNAAINSPQFLSPEFFILNGQVTIDGVADRGSTIDLYRVCANPENDGPLTEPFATVQTDENGRFTVTSTDLQPGDYLSAIATDPNYGTSELAQTVVIRSLGQGIMTRSTSVPTGSCPMPRATF